MPRKVTKKLQRQLKPDRKYQSILVQRLINKSMLDGKKLAAERAVYSALEQAAKKLESEEPLEIFEKALKNISPRSRYSQNNLENPALSHACQCSRSNRKPS